jgi:hypothetical protein
MVRQSVREKKRIKIKTTLETERAIIKPNLCATLMSRIRYSRCCDPTLFVLCVRSRLFFPFLLHSNYLSPYVFIIMDYNRRATRHRAQAINLTDFRTSFAVFFMQFMLLLSVKHNAFAFQPFSLAPSLFSPIQLRTNKIKRVR